MLLLALNIFTTKENYIPYPINGF